MNKNNFKECSIISKDQIDYDEMLKSLIPNLDNYSFLRGGEGKAFFIDRNYVVKVIFAPEEDFETFDMFCKEIVKHSENGLSIPKYYAWCRDKDERYYILQERAKGKNLFNTKESLYRKCFKRYCSYGEFYDIYDEPSCNKELYMTLINEHLNDINGNLDKILKVPDSEVDKFILSLYDLYDKSENALPDVYCENVLCNGKKLTLIDPYPGKLIVSENKKEEIMDKMLADIFRMFYPLRILDFIEVFDIKIKDQVVKARDTAYKNSFLAIKKFIKKSQNLLDYKNGWIDSDFIREGGAIFDDETLDQFMEELERE